jgi:autotransporter-associated beta strand protein/T5SS/PEP-CTERM-associated repeat protein
MLSLNSRTLRRLAVVLLFATTAPVDLRADTILDSGTTTVTTGTSFEGTLFLGDSGTATLAILGGGSAAIGSSYLGYNAGSKGTVVVNGGTWNSLVGYPSFTEMRVGWFGEGTLDVIDGVVTTENMSVGRPVGGKGTVTITSGTVYDWGITVIGYAGVGTLTMNGGSFTSNAGCQLGGWSGTGALLITGGTYSSTSLSMGSGGVGLLDVDGGTFFGSNNLIYNNGIATVSSGTWIAFNYLHLRGNDVSHGRLNVSGGYVSTPSLGVGSEGGRGTVTITGGTLQSGQISVGDSAGTLNVAGGSISSMGTYIAAGGGSGDATVSSGTWANDGDFYIGNIGAGTLTVSGGFLTSGTGYLGVYAGSTGNGTVSSGTWANRGDLTVGVAGTGTLTITGGLVSVAGTLSTGSLGTINVNAGGTLQIGTGTTAGVLGMAAITNNGTLIFNRSNAYTFSGTISGTGAVIKQGAGTLTLSGSNGVAGPTTIQQGVLNLGNPAVLASSAITPLSGGTLTLAPYLSTTVGGLAPNAGGLTDVGSGMVTVAAGLSDADLVAAIVSGRGDGSWNGTSGITSSVAAASGGDRTVGWLDNGDGSVTFAFAAAGDTNLDWQVDILDAANFLSGGKFDTGSPASWNEGDFTYDGVVDILDAASFLSTGLFDAGAYNTPPLQATIAVPEPSTCAMALAGLACGGYSVWRPRRAR